MKPILCIALASSLSACLPARKAPPKVTLAHLRAGAGQLRAGHLDRAEAHFAVAAEYAPRSARAWNGLGLIALARGERQRAETLFRRAVELDGDLAEARNNLGVLALGRGRLLAAIAHLRAALDVDPGYHQARYNLARALHERGELEAARRELQKVVAVEPQRAEAWSALALVCVDLGRRSAAGEALRRADALAPSAPHVLVARGALARAGGDLDTALRAHAEASRRAPGDLVIRAQLGLTLLAAGRDTEAAQELGRVLAARPFASRIHFALGVLAGRRTDLVHAAKAFRRARELSPAFHAAYLQEAAALVGLGRPRDAAVTCAALRRQLRVAEPALATCRRLLGR